MSSRTISCHLWSLLLIWSRNLLLDECGHLKIGEYWVQILDNQIYANQDCCMKTLWFLLICLFIYFGSHTAAYSQSISFSGQTNNGCNLISHLCHDISKDIYSFGLIFYQVDSTLAKIFIHLASSFTR